MEKISKAWDWKNNIDEIWLNPSEESYYLLHRWKERGFSNFLDLGCGLGRHSIQFAREGFHVCAVDLAGEGADYLKDWAGRESLPIDIEVADMHKLPFSDNSFDCLLAYHVISHTSTEGIRKIISEMERVLRPGGELFISLGSKDTFSFKDAGYPKIDENTIRKEGGNEDGIPHFFVDREDLFNLFKNFTIQTIRHTDDCFFAGEKQNSKHYFVLAGKK